VAAAIGDDVRLEPRRLPDPLMDYVPRMRFESARATTNEQGVATFRHAQAWMATRRAQRMRTA
jgi:hypothetical protein